MWRRVDLVWTDVSEERIASIFRIDNTRATNQTESVCSHLLKLVPRSRIIYPEDRGDTFLWNVGSHKIYMAPHTRRRHSSDNIVINEDYVLPLNNENSLVHHLALLRVDCD
jgi:hypothetical protein